MKTQEETICQLSSKERFLNACTLKPVDRPPIWIMRQAGRYLPEYRKLKEKYNFLTLAQTPDLATEVTLMPMQRFNLDAAILFSDILVIPEALGQKYTFKETGGIQLEYSLKNKEQIDRLDTSSIPQKLNYVKEALQLTRKALDASKALIGFGGSPWTLATYMVEGETSKEYLKIKKLAYEDPMLFNQLMEKLTDALIDYFKMQIQSGVDAIQIFDSWAAVCPLTHYWDFSLKWVKRIIDALKETVPFIFYNKGMGHAANLLAQTGASILSVDWSIDLAECHSLLPKHIGLQGNLDPAVLLATPAVVQKEALRLLNAMNGKTGYIFNLGHGIYPQAKLENVACLVETVTQYKNHF